MASESTLIHFIQNYQRSSIFFKIAGVSGAIAVALGAYGSHSRSLNIPENEDFKKRFDSANRYHFLHNIVLLAMPLTKRPYLVGSLFITGQILFCGSLYVAALAKNKTYGKAAPYGGMILMAAWLSMIF